MELGGPAGRAVRVTSGGTRSPPRARYLPIAEHGLIGDLHTVALVGTDGTIDWYCLPAVRLAERLRASGRDARAGASPSGGHLRSVQPTRRGVVFGVSTRSACRSDQAWAATCWVCWCPSGRPGRRPRCRNLAY